MTLWCAATFGLIDCWWFKFAYIYRP